MKFKFRKPLAVLLAVLMLATAFSFSVSGAETSDNSTSAKNYHLAPKIHDGAILHAWCWSFKTIKEQLPQIAEAGFTSVQTSPINQCKVGENGGMQLNGRGKWYYHYQPTLYTIGNYQLGTLDEFRDMCSEADKYGIKIIVDVVANHCSGDYSAISPQIKNIPNAFHPTLEINSWSKRYQVTQGKLSGLWDLNTANPSIQTMIKNYLNDCLEAGADGFRYDAAKHIELPNEPVEDGKDFASDFWTNILDNDAEFQYGEILQGQGDRIADYSQLMSVTASSYGENLRTALANNKIQSRNLTAYQANDVDPTKLVTWVESHDNYCNDGSYSQIDDQQVRTGWAIIAAKGDTTPLFYARPNNSSANNQWGDNLIGAAGNGNYYHPEVAAVNHFRNAMVGETFKIGAIDRNFTHIMVQRGTKGVVIINYGDTDFAVNTTVTMPDGEYTDEAYGDTYTVSGGKISGTVKSKTVAVIYDRESEDYGTIGDVNGDETVDVLDSIMVQKYASEKTTLDERQQYVGDVNDDGQVDVLDAADIQKYAAEKLSEFKKK